MEKKYSTITIELKKYKPRSKLGAGLGLASFFNNSKAKIIRLSFVKSKLNKKVSKLHLLPDSFVRFADDEIQIKIMSTKCRIKYDNIIIKKVGKGMKLEINVEQINLEQLIQNIGDLKIKNPTAKSLLDSINSNVDPEQKRALVKLLIDWMNDNNLFNVMLESLAKDNEKVGRLVDKTEVELGDVKVLFGE